MAERGAASGRLVYWPRAIAPTISIAKSSSVQLAWNYRQIER
jgi:hypothetical protein